MIDQSAYPLPAPPTLVHSHFSTAAELRENQALSWRDQLTVSDLNLSAAQVANGFNGVIDVYRVGDMVFLDSRTDSQVQQRTLARISTDNLRSYVFHIHLEGNVDTMTGGRSRQATVQSGPGILALDLNQPMRMERFAACRAIALFVPRSLLESVLPDAEWIHGRVVGYSSPLTHLIREHVLALTLNLPKMSGAEAERALLACAHLLATAFGKQARLIGTAHAAIRAATLAMIKRYIRANLHNTALSPDFLACALKVPRATLYRMFELEGGVAAYIYHRRLREAANELARFPKLAVKDIAYGLGFDNASNFTRAFRHAFDMTPQDLRSHIKMRGVCHLGGA